MKTTNKPTTAIYLETRKPHKDGRYPVKLRVNYQRQRRYYVLKDENKKNLSMTQNEFNKVMGKSPREPYKEIRTHLNELERIAIEEVINKLPFFTFEVFEAKYFNKKTDRADVFSSLETRAKELRAENRISTAVTFECALNSLKLFHGKESLPFELLTISFLRKYEKWMTTKTDKRYPNSLTTVGIYLRNVRTMYNEAKRDGILKDIPYPFGEGRFQIPGGKNTKKALSQAEVAMIANYPAINGSPEQKYRDFWMFSFLANGLNVKDMARIKYRDIDGDILRITRAKTERENRRSPRLVTIIITKRIGKIIDQWSNKPSFPETYLLPILDSGMTAEDEYKRIQDVTKRINRFVGKIAEKLDIQMKVTTYVARHSHATILKQSGASMEFISESLGHSNLQTTENYLADFEIEEKRKWQEVVGNFDNKRNDTGHHKD